MLKVTKKKKEKKKENGRRDKLFAIGEIKRNANKLKRREISEEGDTADGAINHRSIYSSEKKRT